MSQVQIIARTISAANNPVFGDNQPVAIFVQGIQHQHGEFEKLEFVVFDAEGRPVMSGNETISGDDYINWDKNNIDYPYQYVCNKRGFTLVTE